MNAVQSEPASIVEQPIPTPLLRTVVLCDLVDCTALVEQLGDREAVTFMHRLDRQCRNLLAQHGGRQIDKTDSFLSLIQRPIQQRRVAGFDDARRRQSSGKGTELA